ncbi:nuclear transport factor 2 family protein [Gynurincola endophyticus]|uniref:nuclear transport factor 2 family protein n=1 Tax=Gynurincola endophyticus TaxID=2479004 RepID=UPI000F8C5ADF|nr:nuclear transport factor 2 family protein [Gynurincola endophyticus]
MEDQTNITVRKTVAKNISLGNFKAAYDYLTENVVWNIVGEKLLAGIDHVKEYCETTAAYFESVETDFIIEKIIEDEHHVVVTGNARFVRDGNTIAIISSCDVYEFNAMDKVIEIMSYCIKHN